MTTTQQLLTGFRKHHKLSQSQAATALGVPKRTLQEWEQGRRRLSGLAWEGLCCRISCFVQKVKPLERE